MLEKTIKRTFLSKEDLLNDLRRVAELGGGISTSIYGRSGYHSVSHIQRRFGSWTAALKMAGLDTLPSKKSLFAGPVICLKCDQTFESWDRRKNRVCPPCRNSG